MIRSTTERLTSKSNMATTEMSCNERMCAKFGMLVDRISAMEAGLEALKDSMAVVTEHLSLQSISFTRNHAKEHAQQQQPEFPTFRGLQYCGRPVDLKVYCAFDAEGLFVQTQTEAGDDMLIVMNDGQIRECCQPLWESEGVSWKWDADVLAVWGVLKFAQVRAKSAVLHRSNCVVEDYTPTCTELGMNNVGNLGIVKEAHEVALRNKIPGLRAVGNCGVAVSAVDLKTAVGIMDQVTTLWTTPLCAKLEIYRIPKKLQPLALAVLHEFGVNLAWAALDGGVQQDLVDHQNDEGVFFTHERLAVLLG